MLAGVHPNVLRMSRRVMLCFIPELGEGHEAAPPAREQHRAYLAVRRLRVHPLRECGSATVAWAGRGPLHRAVSCSPHR